MKNTIVDLLKRVWAWLAKLLGLITAWLVWPLMAGRRWYGSKGWMIRAPVLAVLALLVGLYGYFVWQTQVWTNFDPDYISRYRLAERTTPAGQELPVAANGVKQCQPSAIVDVAADLTDFNVNQNAWISSMVLYRTGFFGIDWDDTPFLDNKASLQRGVNQAVRRTSTELVDTLGRVRGTSAINGDLQDARGNLQFDEFSWYFGFKPFGFKTPTPAYYRSAITSLRKFNTDLAGCRATFDTRADNLLQFIDRITNDLGSTSSILRERSEHYNAGWFDMRADDRFWFAYGQLYGYYGVLAAARADFDQVVRERNLAPLWADTLSQFRAALRIQPAIISNGREDGWIMPTHLATMGFYVLRSRSNLVEIRSVLGGR